MLERHEDVRKELKGKSPYNRCVTLFKQLGGRVKTHRRGSHQSIFDAQNKRIINIVKPHKGTHGLDQRRFEVEISND
jgi:hypothetical protein